MNDPVYQLTEKYWKSRGGFVNPSVDKFYDWLLEQEKSKDVEAAIEWAGKYYRVPAHYPSDNRPLSDFRAWYKTTLEDHHETRPTDRSPAAHAHGYPSD